VELTLFFIFIYFLIGHIRFIIKFFKKFEKYFLKKKKKNLPNFFSKIKKKKKNTIRFFFKFKKYNQIFFEIKKILKNSGI